jgi:hypothetical protein
MSHGAYLKEFLILLTKAVPPPQGHAHMLTLVPRAVSVCSAHREEMPDCPACHTVLPPHLHSDYGIAAFICVNTGASIGSVPILIDDTDWAKEPAALVIEVLRAWKAHLDQH